jgi:hypothetical protein
MTNYRSFMVFDGRVEEIDDDATYIYESEPGFYSALRGAGYPVYGGSDESYADTIDLRVEDGRVIVHTDGAADNEHDMGNASELFLAWFRENAEEAS